MISERNGKYFEAEAEKLDRWADDLKVALEREIKEMDRQIREARRKASQAGSLETKLAGQKQIKALEAQRTSKRRTLFDAQDQIDQRREVLIPGIEAKLAPKTYLDPLMAKPARARSGRTRPDAPRLCRATATRRPPAREPLQAPGPGVIVVDSNVIAYCWLNSPMTRLAQRVRVKDPDWHVPVLWRSEVRSILAGYLRDGSLSGTQARRVMREVEKALAGCEHLLSSDAVLVVINATRLSAYDAEFVALAEELSVRLVTEDKAVLKAFPEAALSMEDFLA